MQRSQPFGRAIAMMAAIAAATAMSPMAQQVAMAEIGPYESRGKGKGGGNRRAPGAQMANIRAARKARSVRRHKARH
jgi:hypothetical protein